MKAILAQANNQVASFSHNPFVDLFWKNVDNNTYLGSFHDKLHDFKIAVAKTFANYENMRTVAQAID